MLLEALPGDPAERLDVAGIPAAQAERTRHALGLDRPPAERLVSIVRAWTHGELGFSSDARRPVSEVIAELLPATALLGTTALLAAYALGLLISVLLVRAGPRAVAAAEPCLLFVATAPGFWLAVLALFVFHDLLGWLPGSHAFPAGGGGLAARLRHLVLPAATVALPAACAVARYQLAASRVALAGASVRQARAMGLRESRVAWRDAVLPHLGPVVALLGLDLPVAVSGVLVIEIVFAWPGLGRAGARAIVSGDYPLALAIVALAAAAVVAGELMADGLGLALDPRRRAVRRGRP